MPNESTALPPGSGGRAEPSAEEVRRQLQRILGHRDFEASARTREFLRYVVEETLAGRAHRLKGYCIAVEVFGRSPDFDASLDPIVRIQAGRLRRALEHYYLVAGGDDPVVIGVPKGGYGPRFSRNEKLTTPSSPPTGSVFETAVSRPQGVSIAVLPLKQIPVEAGTGFFADGLAEDFCNELSRYQDLSVMFCRTGIPADETGDYGALSRRLGTRFLLDGSVRSSEGALKVSVRLVDGRTGRQVWAQSYQRILTAGGLIELQEEIARSVAGAVGSEYGIIAQHLLADARHTAPAELSTYEAILRFYEYEAAPNSENGAQCLADLQTAVVREPDYGPAWAALSVLLRNAYILDLPGAEAPGGRPAEYALRGVVLAPRSQLARGAMAQSYFILKDRDAFLREIEATLRLNPGSPFYVGATGYLLILADEREKGRALLEKAVTMNPCLPWWLNHGLCVYHYMEGDYHRALAETSKAGFSVHFWGPLLQAAVLGRLGRTAEARAPASLLLKAVPDFESRARDLTSRPILSEAIVDGLLDGLRRAGLRV